MERPITPVRMRPPRPFSVFIGKPRLIDHHSREVWPIAVRARKQCPRTLFQISQQHRSHHATQSDRYGPAP